MVISEFQKNAAEKVILQFTEFKGKKLFDLRIYCNAADDGQDELWKPTPKGISICRSLLPELKEGIDKALAEFEK